MPLKRVILEIIILELLMRIIAQCLLTGRCAWTLKIVDAKQNCVLIACTQEGLYDHDPVINIIL